MVGLHSFFYAVCKVCFLLYFLRRKKNCLFALHLPRLFFDPRLNFFSFFFFFNFMTKFIVFSRQSLMIAVNSFSLMCTIMLTIPQSLHVVYDITVDRPPGRFPSHHCRNRWSILCFNSEKKKTLATRPHFQICVEGKQTIFFWPKGWKKRQQHSPLPTSFGSR